MKIEINAEFADIQNQLETANDHLFVTGRAGTGKSTLLQHFRTTTQKNVVVLAPTGVAALNVNGQTIHSFFGFPPSITPEQAQKEHPHESLENLIKKIDIIIIDEASMLRADLLDAIDQALRQYSKDSLAFGGKRMVFIGDLYQLPPVVTRDEKYQFEETYPSPYFFDAKVFSETKIKILQLQKVYRQKDQTFINLLNKVRDNSIDQEDLKYINQRLDKYYQAYNKKNEITLCTTNAATDQINSEQLKKITGKIEKFAGETKGNFIRQLPTHQHLEIKVGAQVMMVNNDSQKRWVNGSTGKIIKLGWDEETCVDTLTVKLSNNKTVEVLPHTWETNNYYYDKETETIQTEQIGAFTQYPLKLAWAVTIHKSQGKTFENLVLDIGRGTFAHGQIYVALSRCTSLEGIVLRQPILPKHIWSDQRIHYFLANQNSSSPSKSLTTSEKKNILEELVDFESNAKITYVNRTGQTLQKNIAPKWVGDREYQGIEYPAVSGLDLNSGTPVSFSLKRIMKIEELEEVNDFD